MDERDFKAMNAEIKNQTAVQKFIEAITNSGVVIINQTLIDNCLEMEKQQAHEYAEFAIRCDRKEMKILNFDGFIKLKSE